MTKPAESKTYDESKVPDILKDWTNADEYHQSDITKEGHSVFLHKPSFTEEALTNGLIYARNTVTQLLKEDFKIVKLGMISYRGRIDVETITKTWKDMEMPADCLQEWEFQGEEGEVKVFSVDWAKRVVPRGRRPDKDKDPKMDVRLRNTIVAICKIRARMKEDDAALRRAIGFEQDEGRGPEPFVKKPETGPD